MNVIVTNSLFDEDDNSDKSGPDLPVSFISFPLRAKVMTSRVRFAYGNG